MNKDQYEPKCPSAWYSYTLYMLYISPLSPTLNIIRPIYLSLIYLHLHTHLSAATSAWAYSCLTEPKATRTIKLDHFPPILMWTFQFISGLYVFFLMSGICSCLDAQSKRSRTRPLFLTYLTPCATIRVTLRFLLSHMQSSLFPWFDMWSLSRACVQSSQDMLFSVLGSWS